MEKLKTLRKSKGLTQLECSRLLGLPRTTYWSYENGDAEPNIDMLKKMADFFDVSLDYLCGRPNANLIFVDSLSPNKKQLVNMIKGLSEDETLIALGWIARLANKPIDEVMKNVR